LLSLRAASSENKVANAIVSIPKISRDVHSGMLNFSE